MRRSLRSFGLWAPLLAGVLLSLAAAPCAADAGNAYLQHNLVADTAGIADHTDPNLVNAWGIAASATSPFWVNDGGTGLSTLYNSSGVPSATKAIVPGAGGTTPSVPSGIVFNGTGGFAIAPGHAPNFIFCTQDGTISGWAGAVDATHAILKVDNSVSGAVYDGLAISSSTMSSNPLLFAANFRSGTIDVFDTNYAPVPMPGAFADPSVPAGYAPFNIQNLGGKLYVTYAKQDAARKYNAPGVGFGYVAVFDLNGSLIQHLVSNGPLNSPWGVAIAPAAFGPFANALIVGNFGDGLLNAFDPATGNLLGTLQDLNRNAIRISGLWGLLFGNGGNGGDPNALYFAAGPDFQRHGLFGSIQAAPEASTGAVTNAASLQPVIAGNTWVAVFGANLSATTRSWQAADFKGNLLPTSLDGVGVMVDGKPTYIGYISPKQINLLTPSDSTQGPVQVQVTNNGLTGAMATGQMQALAPACFLFKDDKYITAVHGNFTPVGPPALYPNLSTPAKPGEEIAFFGTGFGPTTPQVPDGQLFTTPPLLTAKPVVNVGAVSVPVLFAGLVAPGIYQFNVVVPDSTPDGDVPVTVQISGISTPSKGVIAVQH
jgi:uncharacterized protein (TIGR03118 family)